MDTTQLVKVKINDQESEVPLSEVLAEYQKGRAGDEKLRTAAEREKALNEREARIKQSEEVLASFEALKSGDPTSVEAAMKRIGRDLLGATDEEVMEALNRVQGRSPKHQQPTGGSTPDGATDTDSTGAPSVYLTDAHMPDSVRSIIKAFEAQGMDPATFLRAVAGAATNVAEGTQNDRITKLLDSDPELRIYFNRRVDPDGTIRKDVFEQVLAAAQGRPGDFDAAAKAELARVKARLLRASEAALRAARATLPGLPSGGSAGSFAAVAAPVERPVYQPGKESLESFYTRLLAWQTAQAFR